jgi:hypothetical protein
MQVAYLVQSNSGDTSAGEPRNVSHRTANTTSDIKNLVTLLDSKATSKIVLVAANSFLKVFKFVLIGEVETLTPAPLIEVCGKLIICID